jgi:hypothetical protein
MPASRSHQQIPNCAKRLSWRIPSNQGIGYLMMSAGSQMRMGLLIHINVVQRSRH